MELEWPELILKDGAERWLMIISFQTIPLPNERPQCNEEFDLTVKSVLKMTKSSQCVQYYPALHKPPAVSPRAEVPLSSARAAFLVRCGFVSFTSKWSHMALSGVEGAGSVACGRTAGPRRKIWILCFTHLSSMSSNLRLFDPSEWILSFNSSFHSIYSLYFIAEMIQIIIIVR